MQDVTGHALDRMSRHFEQIRGYLAERGFSGVDTPLLEETELFVRKSGGELTSRLCSFTDPGGHKVSLRPEFTASVIRVFIQQRESLTVPVRWQYGGPVFRYEQAESEGYRQFTQVGAELIGLAGVEADADTIRTAWTGLERIGVRGLELRIGHLGVLHRLLAALDLSEPAKLFIISRIHALKNGSLSVADLRTRAEEAGVLKTDVDAEVWSSSNDFSADSARVFVERLLSESMPATIGRRTPDQIVSRLLRKMRDADDPGKFEDALNLVRDLGQLRGMPESVLTDSRRIAETRGIGPEVFDELDGLVEALRSLGVPSDRIILDLGLATGISYYTGVIFGLASTLSSGGALLGSGGRYDGLIKALGGAEDVPAIGFAYNLDRVVETLTPEDATPRQPEAEL